MPGNGRKSGTEQRDAQNMYPYMEGFPPCTVGEENASKGWSKVSMPEGVPLDQLATLQTAGSRGIEETGENTGFGGASTVNRTTANRKVIE